MANILILAKPGAGKSTRIATKARACLDNGQTALLTSFGKRNVLDLTQKVGMGLPLPKEKAGRLVCRTIHSLLYRELNPDPGLYLPNVLASSGERLGIHLGRDMIDRLKSGSDNYTDETDTPDDLAYTEVQRLRAMGLSYADTPLSGYLADRVKVMWDLHAKSFLRGYWDFTWLLEEGIRREVSWSADYCAVDEINDLNPLQATLASRMHATGGGDVEYVGDLDQAIYGFAGVDPQLIMSKLPADRIETMETSYRVPSVIAAKAERILGKASWRSPGVIRSAREGGSVSGVRALERVFAEIAENPGKMGSVYVLGRTNWLVNEARALARESGLNVARNGEEDLLKEFCALIVNKPPRLSFRSIPALCAPFLPAKEFYRRGSRARLQRKFEDNPNGSMDWAEFFCSYGTESMRRVLDGVGVEWYRGREFDPLKPIVRFDTFHASKGMEDETVCILTDITEKVETDSKDDEEIRLAYVAVTRASQQILLASLKEDRENRWI